MRVRIDSRGLVVDKSTSNEFTIAPTTQVNNLNILGTLSSSCACTCQGCKHSITIIPEATNANITTPVTLFRPTMEVYVTGTMPPITSDILGKEYLILKNSDNYHLLLSASNPIADGGKWTFNITTVRAFQLLAVSSSNGYYWHVVLNCSVTN